MGTRLIQFIMGSPEPTIDKAATSVSAGNQHSSRTPLSVTSKGIRGEGTATAWPCIQVNPAFLPTFSGCQARSEQDKSGFV